MDEEPETSAPGADLAATAEQYVAAIDEAATGRELNRVEIARLLAMLISAALELPDVDPTSSMDSPEVAVPDLVWPESFPDLYADVLDPLVVPGEASIGSLSDDLLDIYRDVKGPLVVWQAGYPADAVWEWKLSFRSHWKRHATSGLRVLVETEGLNAVGIPGAIDSDGVSSTAPFGGANTPGFFHGLADLVRGAIDAFRL